MHLPCVAGGGCDFQTVELEEYWQSKELLEAHLEYVHPLAASAGGAIQIRQKEVIVEKCKTCLTMESSESDTKRTHYPHYPSLP